MKHVPPPRTDNVCIKRVVGKYYNVRIRATVPNGDTPENRYEFLKRWYHNFYSVKNTLIIRHVDENNVQHLFWKHMKNAKHGSILLACKQINYAGGSNPLEWNIMVNCEEKSSSGIVMTKHTSNLIKSKLSKLFALATFIRTIMTLQNSQII